MGFRNQEALGGFKRVTIRPAKAAAKRKGVTVVRSKAQVTAPSEPTFVAPEPEQPQARESDEVFDHDVTKMSRKEFNLAFDAADRVYVALPSGARVSVNRRAFSRKDAQKWSHDPRTFFVSVEDNGRVLVVEDILG